MSDVDRFARELKATFSLAVPVSAAFRTLSEEEAMDCWRAVARHLLAKREERELEIGRRVARQIANMASGTRLVLCFDEGLRAIIKQVDADAVKKEG